MEVTAEGRCTWIRPRLGRWCSNPWDETSNDSQMVRNRSGVAVVRRVLSPAMKSSRAFPGSHFGRRTALGNPERRDKSGAGERLRATIHVEVPAALLVGERSLGPPGGRSQRDSAISRAQIRTPPHGLAEASFAPSGLKATVVYGASETRQNELLLHRCARRTAEPCRLCMVRRRVIRPG